MFFLQIIFSQAVVFSLCFYAISFYIYKAFLENQFFYKSVWNCSVSFYVGRVGFFGFIVGFSGRDFINDSEIIKQHRDKDQLWKIGYTAHYDLYELISNASLGKKHQLKLIVHCIH